MGEGGIIENIFILFRTNRAINIQFSTLYSSLYFSLYNYINTQCVIWVYIYVTIASTVTYIYYMSNGPSIPLFILYTMYMEVVMIALVTKVNNLLTSLLSYY